MKRILGSILAIVTLLTATVTLTACDKKAEYTRVTMDINPSVELIVDANGGVISVTALNDDGATLIAGESLCGKPLKTVAEQIVSLAVQTGFLTEGNVETGDNTLSISVSGNQRQSKKTYETVLSAAYDLLKEKGVDTYIERVDAWGEAALKKAVAENSVFTEEEVAKMSEAQLYKALAASRIETAQLLSEEMRVAYFAAKEHKICITKNAATEKIIELSDGLLSAAHLAFISASDAYTSAVNALDKARYDLLVSPTSSYQTALNNLREKKDELILARKKAAALEDSANKAEADFAVIQAEYAYEAALNLLTTLGETANATLTSLIATLRTAEDAFAQMEAAFPTTVKDAIAQKAQETENKVNAAKDAFFASFEQAHGADIAALQTAMEQRKQALIAAAKGE